MRRRGFRMVVTMRVFRPADVRTTACLAMPERPGCVGFELAAAGRRSPYGQGDL